MSFDNALFHNMEDPLQMPPLDIPIDDKRPLPQVWLGGTVTVMSWRQIWCQAVVHRIFDGMKFQGLLSVLYLLRHS